MEHQIIIVVFVVLLSMFINDYMNKPVWTLCDTEKCPYCYGTDFCENIQMNEVTLSNYNFPEIFSNYFSVKNVYKGVFKNQSVILKKLGHNSELDELDDLICQQNSLDKNCVLSAIVDRQNYGRKVLEFLNGESLEGSFGNAEESLRNAEENVGNAEENLGNTEESLGNARDLGKEGLRRRVFDNEEAFIKVKDLGKADNFDIDLEKPIIDKVQHFKTCDKATSQLFVDKLVSINSVVEKDHYMKILWTTLQMNVEPLVLQVLGKTFPTPFLYGACGRLIVLNNAGEPLNSLYKNDWVERAYVALQIVKAARAFTEEHEEFRFYLTDISPDNIVVDGDLKVTFIDLENVIIKKKTEDFSSKHQSEDLVIEEDYFYEEQKICNSSISDHNIFAVCKLLLSEKAPYPMMSRGLLHSPPTFVKQDYSRLLELVRICETPTAKIDRFEASKDIEIILENLLIQQKFKLL